ncbi:MAG: hypothetical protein U1E65_30520 [Myxococcota bacterium]
MRRALWMWLPAAVACQSVTAVPEPDRAGAASVVTVIASANAVLRAQAGDVGAAEAALPSFSWDPSDADTTGLTVTDLGFRCPLSELGISAGPITLNDAPTPRLEMPLPTFGSLLDLGAHATTWRPVNDLKAWTGTLARIPLGVPSLCHRYGAVLSDTEGFQAVDLSPFDLAFADLLTEALVPLPEGAALALLSEKKGQKRRYLFRIDRQGQVSRLDIPYRIAGNVADFPSGRLAMGPDQRLWMVTQTGSVARGSVDSGLDVIGNLRWFGTNSSTIPAHLTRIWMTGDATHPRVLAGFTQDDGVEFLESAESAVLAFAEGGPPELVDTLPGFGQPAVTELDDGAVLIAGMDLEHGHLRRVTRETDGTWTATEQRWPSDAPGFGADRVTPAWVGRTASGLRVAFTNFSIKLLSSTRYISIVGLLMAEGPLGDLKWVPESSGFPVIPTDVVELPGGLVLHTGLDGVQNGFAQTFQRKLRSCGGYFFEQPRGPMYDLDRTRTFDEYRSFAVALDDDTVLISPSHTIRTALLFHRAQHPAACLVGE